MFADVIAFADLFDDALAIRKQVEFGQIQPIPVNILTDSKSMLDICFERKSHGMKWIMLDLYAARQA